MTVSMSQTNGHGSAAWLCRWVCGCTCLEWTRTAIPELCPTHGTERAGRLEFVTGRASVFGYQPATEQEGQR